MQRKKKSAEKKPPERELLLEGVGLLEVCAAACELGYKGPGILQRAGWEEGMRFVGPHDELLSDQDPTFALSLTKADIFARDWQLWKFNRKHETPLEKVLPGEGSRLDRALLKADEALKAKLENETDEEGDEENEAGLDLKSELEKLDRPSDNRRHLDEADEIPKANGVKGRRKGTAGSA